MSVERARTSSPEGIPSPFGDSKQKVSVERLELSTNGLKGQLVKNAVDNQGISSLCQSIGWVDKKVSWLRLLKFSQHIGDQ